MKREVIVWVDEPLTKKERRMFKKEHPGKRLCFRLRYPNFPKLMWVFCILVWLCKWIMQ